VKPVSVPLCAADIETVPAAVFLTFTNATPLVKSEDSSTESLNETVVVGLDKVIVSPGESVAPEILSSAPAEVDEDPTAASPPVRFVKVTAVGADPVVKLTD
jgi:hypothetical protein